MSSYNDQREPANDRSADGGVMSVVGNLTREHIAPDLRALAVPIETLQRAPDNARRHADADLVALAESLRLHGQRKPVVAKREYRGMANVLLAGNGTLAAARRLGWSYLAVTWFDRSDDEAQAFAIRDNRTAELSAWDSGQLAGLAADGLDLLALWHDDAALADLLRADAPVPRFEPAEAEHRLDQLQAHCRTCTCRQEVR